MIKKLQIRNFKCFDTLDISDLYKVTLVGGINNIGKTALLEALFLFHDRLNTDMMIKSSIWRGINAIKLEPQHIWAPAFANYDMDKKINISLTNDLNKTEKLEIGINKNFISGIKTGESKDKNIHFDKAYSKAFTSSQEIISALDINVLRGGENIQHSILTISFGEKGIELNHVIEHSKRLHVQAKIIPSNYNHPIDDAQLYGQLDLAGKEKTALEFLRIMEPKLKSLSVIALGPNATIIHADVGNGRKIPIPYLGDGMRRLLSIILSIANMENGLVLIDEIENGIHYTVLPKIWNVISKAAEKFNCQIIATTHSDECIKASLEGFVNDKKNFGYIRLDKNKENKIEAKIYSYNVLNAAVESKWEVR